MFGLQTFLWYFLLLTMLLKMCTPNLSCGSRLAIFLEPLERGKIPTYFLYIKMIVALTKRGIPRWEYMMGSDITEFPPHFALSESQLITLRQLAATALLLWSAGRPARNLAALRVTVRENLYTRSRIRWRIESDFLLGGYSFCFCNWWWLLFISSSMLYAWDF